MSVGRARSDDDELPPVEMLARTPARERAGCSQALRGPVGVGRRSLVVVPTAATEDRVPRAVQTWIFVGRWE